MCQIQIGQPRGIWREQQQQQVISSSSTTQNTTSKKASQPVKPVSQWSNFNEYERRFSSIKRS